MDRATSLSVHGDSVLVIVVGGHAKSLGCISRGSFFGTSGGICTSKHSSSMFEDSKAAAKNDGGDNMQEV